MIYTVKNTIKAGRRVDYIADAHGNRIDGPTIECNTETGEVIQYRTNQNGLPVVASTGTHFVRRRMIFQKPLRVVFFDRLTSPGQ